jgi:hypothetical protein
MRGGLNFPECVVGYKYKLTNKHTGKSFIATLVNVREEKDYGHDDSYFDIEEDKIVSSNTDYIYMFKKDNGEYVNISIYKDPYTIERA